MKRLLTLAATVFMAIGVYAAHNNGSKSSDNQQTATVIELTAEKFSKLVYDINSPSLKYLGDKPAIVDFYATWCAPCKKIAPILEELAEEYKGKIVIYKVNLDRCKGLTEAFDISSIPAIMYIPVNGTPQMTVGARDKAKFVKEIQTYLLK
jgi:thioredoxin